eukprot:TRINITY_DN2431_c0_g1_i1.p1 TRINITY_DN2431_c0_g1~~TRINITY_DN2431_c0_g1_i1.p1  ORF type:complete len:1068 (+),score=305.24 TRINITY_DN2431_c0_g1_i1:257-3460(+)
MSDKRVIDAKAFVRHIEALYKSWKTSKDALWNGADILVVAYGASNDTEVFKASAIQLWLLGWEFPEMVIVFTQKTIYIASSAYKISLLEPLVAKVAENKALPELKLLVRSKAEDAKVFASITKELKGKGTKIGVLSDAHTGDMIDAWSNALKELKLTQVDIEEAISSILAVKDKIERNNMKTAATISGAVMKRFLIPDMEHVIDKGESITHSALAEKINELYNNPEKISPKLEAAAQTVEPTFLPIIQSGGYYDLKLNAVSNDEELHFGTIICIVGTRFRSYCAAVGRTFFINPTPEQKACYDLLLKVQQEVLKTMKPGTPISKVMEAATKYISASKPELLDKFVQNCGYGTGVETEESYLTISKTNNKPLKEGMAFTLLLGFNNLTLSNEQDPKKKNYAIMLVDCVLVEEKGAQVLTEMIRTAYQDISYFIEEDDESKKGPKIELDAERVSRNKSKKNEAELKKKAEEEARKAHQEELVRQRQEEAKKRYTQGSMPKGGSSGVITDKTAYDSIENFPVEANPNKIFVDAKREAVLLPIFGTHVPFHISTIRKVSKTEKDLRITFLYPGVSFTQKLPDQSVATSSFIREMTFRIPDPKVLGNTIRLMNDVKKASIARETQRREMQGLTKQKKLVLLEGRPPQLNKVFIRPQLGGKAKTGTLAAHKNGLRFTAGPDAVIDIMYENIKHAFFQPSDGEMVVLLHFRLRNAIMVGKKKTTDVQFFTVVVEVSQKMNTTSGQSLEDEIEDEVREKKFIERMNGDFYSFVKQTEEIMHKSEPDLEFDIPYRELGFFGAPNRGNVLLLPTKDCVVHLTEPPFFVVAFEDIEIANLERVTAGVSKHFDMVFVLKDHAQPVITIRAIPFSSLDDVKKLLDQVEIVFYEGPQSIHWASVMKYVREDEKSFYEEGGWDPILRTPSDDEGDDESEEEFQPEEEDDDDEYDEDDDDEEYDEGDDEEEESDDEEEEESDGEDWESLEKRAKEEDKKRGAFDGETKPKSKRNAAYSSDEEDSEDEKPRKPAAKKAKTGGGGGGGASRSGASSSKSSSSSNGARPGGAPKPGAKPASNMKRA